MVASFSFLVIIFAGLVVGQSSEKRGIQLRLTQKGLDYAIEESLKILQDDILHKPIKDFSGGSGGFDITGRKLRVLHFNVGSKSMSPDYGKGLKVAVADISISLSGELHYEKHLWFIKIRDTVSFQATANRVSFSLSLHIGKTSNGHPDVSVNWCNSDVGSLDLHFSGSKSSWLYNLFSSVIEDKLRGELADLMCKSAKDSINTRTRQEMNEFPVRKVIDEWAIIDYTLSASPYYGHSFMDIFLRGEFFQKKNPSHHSSLPIPSFTTAVDNSKMLYLWLTDYSFNTAGEVYHDAGFLVMKITRKSNVPPLIKKFLDTRQFRALIPELYRRFPRRPMQMTLYSYKAPKFVIESGEVFLHVYGMATFQVVQKDGSVYNAFSLQLDVKVGATPLVTEKYIKGKMNDFTFKMNVAKSNIGPINIPIRLPLIQSLVKASIIKAAKRGFEKGFPLPNLNEVYFKSPEVKIVKNAIQIGVDCNFIRNKRY
ncbi:lipopolysaccharide-binding protein-like isoform X2 [Rhopilema esculentum]|uniref:lipopolysaccharide-binding protein-like isoform X1 n=1 Tax=Rhopilema esculentum TaxID=499914 RepID=UPI0031E40B75